MLSQAPAAGVCGFVVTCCPSSSQAKGTDSGLGSVRRVSRPPSIPVRTRQGIGLGFGLDSACFVGLGIIARVAAGVGGKVAGRLPAGASSAAPPLGAARVQASAARARGSIKRAGNRVIYAFLGANKSPRGNKSQGQVMAQKAGL